METKARAETELDGITLPAGEYFISDPCYLLADEDDHSKWMAVLTAVWSGESYTKDGLTAVIFHTANGDGKFQDNYDRTYEVDAGLIGIIPMAMATRTKYLDRVGAVLQRATFDKPFTCSGDDGVLRFGDISIDTELFRL